MALMEVTATKSSLLALRRQLSFAEEGYALLEQKRELLVFELARAAALAQAAARRVEEELEKAYSELLEAELAGGSAAVDRAALGVKPGYALKLGGRRLMGLRLPEASASSAPGAAAFGPGGVPAGTDAALRAFSAALPLAAELAGLETSRARVARELKKTQRRCNALSKKVIPDCRETIAYLGGALEEREREAFVELKMIRDRLRVAEAG